MHVKYCVCDVCLRERERERERDTKRLSLIRTTQKWEKKKLKQNYTSF